jgi:hypothetical protein
MSHQLELSMELYTSLGLGLILFDLIFLLLFPKINLVFHTNMLFYKCLTVIQ